MKAAMNTYTLKLSLIKVLCQFVSITAFKVLLERIAFNSSQGIA